MRRLALLLLCLAAPAAALPAAAAATPRTEIVERRAVAQDTERVTYRYGPLVASAGANQILIGPVTIERPAGDVFVTRVRPGLVRADGTVPPVEALHMHHAVFLSMRKADVTVPSLPERFFAFAEEKTTGRFPAGYGYRVAPTDVWAINYMLHNGTPVTEAVFIEYELDVVAADSPTGRALTPLRPVWLDVENGKAYPVFDVLRGQGTDGRVTYPRDARPWPYGGGPARNEWRADRDGVLVAAAGHLHPGGLWVDLEVERDGVSAPAFRSRATYFDPNGPVSWDMAMDLSAEDWRVGVRAGDVLRVSTTYETERASWYESMGIMLAYMADGAPAPDPFEQRLDTPGAPTHGHLPEAGNHGGEPTGLADPRARPPGQTIDRRVGVAAFSYLPGDLGLPDPFGLPPQVRRGETLRFGNLDAAAGILHTITACAPPCTGATGVSYPLADGPVALDSGQLGYGPSGFTAAAQRAEWEVPADLASGTYTYFCRVHPAMRGAFRVTG